MRLLINRIVRELESGRTFLRPDRLVHGSQCLFRIILRVIHSIYHILIAIHFAALRHLRVFIQDMCLEQLCIITAHVIITDICLIPGSVCFLICIPGYILAFFLLKHRISPGCVNVIIIAVALHQIPCMVSAFCRLSCHISTEHTKLFQ